MPIEIEYFGQACIAISDGREEIVCDPWYSGPAHLNSWYPVPSADDARRAVLRARFDRASHLYISHDHADHFDVEWLRSLAPKTLLVARFRNRGFREALASTGHRVVALEAGQTHTLGEHTLRIIPEQPRCRTNSMLLVQSPIGSVLNANDCGLNTAMLQAIGQRERVRLFLYTLNFMANGFPFPYLRSDAPDLAQRMDEVRDQVLEGYRLALRALRPERAVAFAGPVTFGDAINAHLNRHPEALDWRAMIERLRPDAPAGEGVWWPTPGARVIIDEGGSRLEDHGSWPELIREHLRRAPSHAGVPVPAAEPKQLRAAAQACLTRLGASLDQAPRRVGTPLVMSGVDRLEELETGPLRWTASIDFDARAVELVEHAVPDPRGLRPAPRPPYLWIVACHDAALGFLRGEVKLDDLLLSAHARFTREPDAFNAALHELLRFGHDDESLAEVTRLRSRPATVGEAGELEVETQGERFTIPRLCPHEAESLELATTCGYELTCPRHRWVFDLRSGACVRGGDPNTNLYGARAPKPSR